MPLPLRVRALAKRDVREITHIIAGDDADAGDRFVDTLRADLDLICGYPGVGTQRSSTRKSLRKLRSCPMASPFRNYLVFFLPRWNRVEVVRVLHGARDLKSIFAEA